MPSNQRSIEYKLPQWHVIDSLCRSTEAWWHLSDFTHDILNAFPRRERCCLCRGEPRLPDLERIFILGKCWWFEYHGALVSAPFLPLWCYFGGVCFSACPMNSSPNHFEDAAQFFQWWKHNPRPTVSLWVPSIFWHNLIESIRIVWWHCVVSMFIF